VKNSMQFLTAVIFAVAMLSSASAQTGSGPSDPAPVGTVVTGIIECGEGYTSHELYDMKITLIEVLRGEKAWKRIQEAGNTQKPTEPETEYLLARVRYEFYARGNPGTCVHQLVPDEFAAYNKNGEDYKAASVSPPKPELRKSLKSGESFEGWVAFSVAKEDSAPLMLYSADTGGAVEHGGGKWFLLR
jgi:hypothetical protein